MACLTVRIEHMKAHCAANKQVSDKKGRQVPWGLGPQALTPTQPPFAHSISQDKAAKRAYTMLLTRRRDLLQYLRRKDFAAYIRTLEELGITGFS